MLEFDITHDRKLSMKKAELNAKCTQRHSFFYSPTKTWWGKKIHFNAVFLAKFFRCLGYNYSQNGKPNFSLARLKIFFSALDFRSLNEKKIEFCLTNIESFCHFQF